MQDEVLLSSCKTESFFHHLAEFFFHHAPKAEFFFNHPTELAIRKIIRNFVRLNPHKKKMKKPFLCLLSLVIVPLLSLAQRSPEQLGGVYYAYPVTTQPLETPVPDGFAPFFVSHYGRHGSRWLPDDKRYEWVWRQMADTHNLTAKGKRLRRRLRAICADARGNGGRLTPLGARQHEGIARRMAERLPWLLDDGVAVRAWSSTSGRCRASMEAFVGEWQRLRPGLCITMTTDSADMRWMAYDSPDELLLQEDTHVPLGISPDAFLRRLFKDLSRVSNPDKLFSELFTIASDMQDRPELRLSLYGFFTREEMEACYRQATRRMWHQNGNDPSSHGVPAQCAARLWRQMVLDADSAIARATTARREAALRFGHDTALYRLLTLLGFDSSGLGVEEMVPMAANLQMVFYRNARDSVIVKLLLNERELRLPWAAGVYVPWAALKAHGQPYVETQKWKDRTQAVNTLVGTDYAVTASVGRYGKGSEEHGQTIPAVLAPHGHTMWTPQTQATEQKCVAPYYYGDSLFQGFRASHWINGGCTQDYGSFTVMAAMDSMRTSPTVWGVPFRHEDETAHPYSYGVRLPQAGVTAEVTATPHCGLLRFTPQRGGRLCLAFHANGQQGTQRLSQDRVTGCSPVRRIYQGWGEPAGFAGWMEAEVRVRRRERDGWSLVAPPLVTVYADSTTRIVALDVRPGDKVLVRVGNSFVSAEGARKNLAVEMPGWDFLAMRLRLDSLWCRRLQAIDVDDPDEARVNQFYGALYRSSFLPRVFSDVDGRHPPFGGTSPCVQEEGREARPFFMDFSMWDIYRAQAPLEILLDPGSVAGMVSSLATMYEQGGWMPVFPCWNSYTAAMIGDHAAPFIADAVAKGVAVPRQVLEKAYEGLRKNAFDNPTPQEYGDGKGRRALRSYLRYGYIPLEDSVPEAFHQKEQVSRTLEYAYDDFCLAQLAQALGRADDHAALMRRARNWRNAINPVTGWADARHADGRWLGGHDLTTRVPFITEGTVMHYSFYVPHDVEALVGAMGGRERFIARLDTLFDWTGSGIGGNAFYWHGNEPCHQIPYLYDYVGQPWKTRRIVADILKTEYKDVPGGLSGNDDAGQMSAWLVFSSMGFYPVCPGTPVYALGLPAFRRVRMGNLTIETDGATGTNGSVTWNGQPYTSHFITHDMIMRGGTLRFAR